MSLGRQWKERRPEWGRPRRTRPLAPANTYDTPRKEGSQMWPALRELTVRDRWHTHRGRGTSSWGAAARRPEGEVTAPSPGAAERLSSGRALCLLPPACRLHKNRASPPRSPLYPSSRNSARRTTRRTLRKYLLNGRTEVIIQTPRDPATPEKDNV